MRGDFLMEHVRCEGEGTERNVRKKPGDFSRAGSLVRQIEAQGCV